MHKFKKRPIAEATIPRLVDLGLTDLQANILLSRYIGKLSLIKKFLTYNLDRTDNYKLKDAVLASKYIHTCMKDNQHILLLTDYDADGLTSAAVMYLTIKRVLEYDNVSVITNDRINGNGITEPLLDKVLELHENKPIDLIITADHGSSDEPSFKKLKDLGINVVATDHHEIPESGIPTSVNYFINPQQPNCKYSKAMSGCGVAYVLMEELMNVFKSKDSFPIDEESALIKQIKALVGISIIADSMDLSDYNNRYYVREALRIIQREGLPIFDSSIIGNGIKDEMFLSFNVIPMINSASRMRDSYKGFKYLIAEDLETAKDTFKELKSMNKQRKINQVDLMKKASNQFILDDLDIKVKVASIPNALGINGIIASNFIRRFNAPSVIFNDTGADYISGSGRSPGSEFNIRDAYSTISKKHKGLVSKFGGHKGAAGINVKRDGIELFKREFNNIFLTSLNGVTQSYKYYDYEINPNQITLPLLNELHNLSPYGKGWERPVFKTKFSVIKHRLFGKNKEHISLTLGWTPNDHLDAVGYNINHDNMFEVDDYLTIYYTLDHKQVAPGKFMPAIKIEYIED